MAGKIRNAPGWLGLSDDRTDFVYLEERAEVVRRIFQLSISGMGGYTIAKLLNEEKVPAFGTSAKWEQSTIHNMLSSRATFGEYQKKEIINGKEVSVGEPVPHYYPAVIDLQTFEAAQQTRRQNLSDRRGRKGSQITNLFADIPRCAYCGSGVKLHNAPVKSLVCKKVWKKEGCVPFKWSYSNFEKTFLTSLLETELGLRLKPLLNEAEAASVQNRTSDLYRARLSITQWIRSVDLDLKIAFAGRNPQPFGGLVRRDHADRFLTISLKDGSCHTFHPCLPEKSAPTSHLDPQKIAQQLGLSQRQALITSLLAQGEKLGDIAKGNGMTLSTARWHLREIFRRTGCHSQLELKDLAEKVCPKHT